MLVTRTTAPFRNICNSSRRGALARAFATTSLTSTSTSSSPLRPSVPTNDLGLPLTPLPPPIPSSVPRAPLDRAALTKLCTLAALNPPAEGSEAETRLLAELGELVGLMDLVGEVQLEQGEDAVGALLTEGVGELVIDGSEDAKLQGTQQENNDRGRELLQYATNRVGDFYGFRTSARE